MRNAIDKLTDDEVVELSTYITGAGRYWRKHFENDDELPASIMKLRTRLTPAIAHSLDTNVVHAEAKQVLDARAAPVVTK